MYVMVFIFIHKLLNYISYHFYLTNHQVIMVWKMLIISQKIITCNLDLLYNLYQYLNLKKKQTDNVFKLKLRRSELNVKKGINNSLMF